MPREPYRRGGRAGGANLWSEAELALAQAMLVRLKECLPGRTAKAILLKLSKIEEAATETGAEELA